MPINVCVTRNINQMKNIKIIKHTYKIESTNNQSSIYRLEQSEGSPVLTDLIKIEKSAEPFNEFEPDSWLWINDTDEWENAELVTDLGNTEIANLFFGSRMHNGILSLIVFKFFEYENLLTIDYYVGYYPPTKGGFQAILNKYR